MEKNNLINEDATVDENDIVSDEKDENIDSDFANEKSDNTTLTDKYARVINNNTQTIRVENMFGNFNIANGNGQNAQPHVELPKKTDTDSTNANIIYRLNIKGDLANFVSQKKTSKSLAYAIVLCLFEYVLGSDISVLVESFYSRLPKIENAEERYKIEKDDMYLSQYSILESFGATEDKGYLYKGSQKISSQIITFSSEEYRTKALYNFWNEFPMFRDIITDWLFNILHTSRSIIRTQSIKALAEINKIDLIYGLEKIIGELAKNKKNIYLISSIICEMAKKEELLPNINNLLEKYCSNDSLELWKIPVICLARNVKGEYTTQLQSTINTKIGKALWDLEKDDSFLEFLGRLLIYSTKLQDIVITSLCQKKLLSIEYKHQRSQAYLILLLYTFKTVDANHLGLPLVVLNDKQRDKIAPLLRSIFYKKSYRNLFFILITEYILIIEKKDKEKVNIDYLKEFFLTVSNFGENYYSNLIWFLETGFTDNRKVSNEIYNFLYKNHKNMLQLTNREDI